MAITQQRFLNSTITSYTASLGWNDTPSQVSVSLVDDPATGDSFDPGFVGRPVVFAFGNFSFCGIIQSFGDRFGTSGFTHDVTITDPRDILDGVYLILDGYTGSVADLPNLLNIYGYLESYGFGYSQKNETGLPWRLVANSVRELSLLPQQGVFGGPVYYVQSRYIIDLSFLPNVPEDFRVGGESITLLGFIQEVCDAGGCDFFITMTETFTGVFVIQVQTVSRTAIINYGAVSQFLGSFSEYEDKSIGRELANETSSKFLVGGPIREMWYQYSDFSLATVWPFWGFDINGNPNIGYGYGDNHTVVLDSRSVNNPRVGPWYQTNVAEIRAVLAGRASWETFLMLKSDAGGIHSGKARGLALIGYTFKGDIASLFNDIYTNYSDNNNEVTLDFVKMFHPHASDNLDIYDQLDIETGYLYDFLYGIATEYYGKKFMVSIPYTYAATEPDTGKIRVSRLPVDSAFLDESLWPIGVSNNLLPLEVDRFTEEDGQIVCFVRFNSGTYLDLSELNNDSVAFSSSQPQFGRNKLQNYSIFVKAQVDNSIVFLDKRTQWGPRAVITLDGVVHDRAIEGDYSSKQILVDFLNGNFSSRGVDVSTEAYKTNVIDKLLGNIGQDILNYSADTTAVVPDLAVIPLESQTNFYGPWYSTGGYGKMDYEKDDSLVPWNYGGFTAMNVAANAKVNYAIGTNQQVEQGEITFSDYPSHNLGQAIMAGGPCVTDVTVVIGEGGAHTTYKFRRNVKQPRYGQARADRVATLARTQQRLKRNMRLRGQNQKSVDLKRTKEPIKPITSQSHPKIKKTSSHEMLVGQSFTQDDKTSASVFLQSDYNFLGHAKFDYANKAYMSLDGLLRPFSTKEKDADDETITSMPYFEEPSEDAAYPTIDDLNPFKGNYDGKLIAADYSPNADLYTKSDTDNYRGLALRGPVVIAGWGVDINEKPVPNSTPDEPGDSFLTDYKEDFTTWKVGPLDVRWDDDRKLWVSGGGGGLIRATMKSTTSARLINANKNVTVINWLGSTIGSGDNVFLTKDNGAYYIVNQAYYSASLVKSMVCQPDGTFRTCYTAIKTPSRITPSTDAECT